MYFLEWIILTSTGIGIGIVAFIWALRSGQFAEQERARYLPLSQESMDPPAELPSRLTAEVYVLLFVIVVWFSAMVSTLFLTFH